MDLQPPRLINTADTNRSVIFPMPVFMPFVTSAGYNRLRVQLKLGVLTTDTKFTRVTFYLRGFFSRRRNLLNIRVTIRLHVWLPATGQHRLSIQTYSI